MKFVLTGLAAVSVLGLAQAQEPALDEKAYSAVWDSLVDAIPQGNETNIVHILEVPQPAVWAEDGAENLVSLQKFAGALPEAKYILDPSRLSRGLHDVYTAYVLDIDMPILPDKDREEFKDASAKYSEFYRQWLAKVDEYYDRWDKEKERLEEVGRQPSASTRIKFRDRYGGMFSGINAQLSDAFADVQQYRAVNAQWWNAVQRLHNVHEGLYTDLGVASIYDYNGGRAELNAAMSCSVDSDDGWKTIEFNNSIETKEIRRKNWNASGGWSGGFFSGSGGGSSYSYWASQEGEGVKLRFCNLRYVPVSPGPWFYSPLLEQIEEGAIQLKPDSAMCGIPIFGPDGKIPRLVKGMLVADKIEFSARYSDARQEEFKRQSSRRGGFRIGSFRVGGSGGSSSESSRQTKSDGSYSISTNYTVPVMLAIVSEPTPQSELDPVDYCTG